MGTSQQDYGHAAGDKGFFHEWGGSYKFLHLPLRQRSALIDPFAISFQEKKEISVWRGDFVFKVLKSKIVNSEDKPEV